MPQVHHRVVVSLFRRCHARYTARHKLKVPSPGEPAFEMKEISVRYAPGGTPSPVNFAADQPEAECASRVCCTSSAHRLAKTVNCFHTYHKDTLSRSTKLKSNAQAPMNLVTGGRKR